MPNADAKSAKKSASSAVYLRAAQEQRKRITEKKSGGVTIPFPRIKGKNVTYKMEPQRKVEKVEWVVASTS